MGDILHYGNKCEDGVYFLKLLRKENEKLERLVCQAESELESDRNLSEEVSGRLRIAAGKARLLMRQKFQQFEDLCRKNLEKDPREQLIVTCEDLAGYWDVVKLQITQIQDIFDQSYDLMKRRSQKTQC